LNEPLHNSLQDRNLDVYPTDELKKLVSILSRYIVIVIIRYRRIEGLIDIKQKLQRLEKRNKTHRIILDSINKKLRNENFCESEDVVEAEKKEAWILL